MARRTRRGTDDWLGRPWRLPKLPGETEIDRARRARDAGAARYAEVVNALIKRYRLDRNDPNLRDRLIWEMAHEFVRGLTFVYRPRRARDVAMFQEVVAMRARYPRRSMNDATERVAKKHGQSVRGFRSRYQRWRINRG